MMSAETTEPDEGITVYSPLRLAGRDVYVREGCYNCHSQMVRPIRAETERYGEYSKPGEFVYDQLRVIARGRMRQERSSHTLEATALVHEAYLRLVDGDKAPHWDSRVHFFAAAAEA